MPRFVVLLGQNHAESFILKPGHKAVVPASFPMSLTEKNHTWLISDGGTQQDVLDGKPLRLGAYHVVDFPLSQVLDCLASPLALPLTIGFQSVEGFRGLRLSRSDSGLRVEETTHVESDYIDCSEHLSQVSLSWYIDGIRQTQEHTEMYAGQVLDYLGCRLVFGAQGVSLLKPASLVVSAERFQHIVLDEAIAEDDAEVFIRREPNTAILKAPDTVAIEPPPGRQQAEQTPMWQTMVPLLTAGISSIGFSGLAISQAMQTQQWLYALPSVLMACSMLTSALVVPTMQRRYQRRRQTYLEAKRQQVYRRYLWRTSIDVLQAQEDYIAAVAQRYPMSVSQFWQHRLTQDALTIRLGNAQISHAIPIQLKEEAVQLELDVLSKDFHEFPLSFAPVENGPAILSLMAYRLIGVCGVTQVTTRWFYHLLNQAMGNYGYDDLSIIVIGASDCERNALKWCPHVWDETGRCQVTQSVAETAYVLRQLLRQATEQGEASGHRWLLCIRDDELLADRVLWQGIQELSSVSIMYFSVQASHLPQTCQLIINARYRDARATITNLAEDTLHFSSVTLGQLTLPQLADWTQRLAGCRLLDAPFNWRQERVLGFLETQDIQHLSAGHIREQWASHATQEGSLAVVVGRDDFQQPIILDIHDRADGAHGIIAGMTGSGKSEWLLNYLLALALNYSPHMMTFALIDFKGGNVSQICQQLPHVVGTLTNLDEGEAERVLVSLKQELAHRQRLFHDAQQHAQVGVMTIDIYHQLLRSGRVTEPMPHLLIVVDEFAELKQERPEFMKQMIQIARIGRSLGVHLLLATQKPHGVVDDHILSNMRFKICLKLQESMDSRDLLGTTDATLLKQPGAFYLSVGNRERYLRGQAGWSGATYLDDSIYLQMHIGSVFGDWKDYSPYVNTHLLGAPPEVRVVVDTLEQLTEEQLRPLWLTPLATKQPLATLQQELSEGEHTAGAVIVGRYDDLQHRTQPVLQWRFEETGHIAVYGDVGSGKRQLVTSLVADLQHRQSMRYHYLIDMSNQLESLSDQVNYSSREQAERTLEDIAALLRQRQQSTTTTYPWLVVIVHEAAPLLEQFSSVAEHYMKILREGRQHRIIMITTVTCQADIPYRFTDYIQTNVCLRLADKTSYSSLLGRFEEQYVLSRTGQGLMRCQQQVVMFQIANTEEEDAHVEAHRN